MRCMVKAWLPSRNVLWNQGLQAAARSLVCYLSYHSFCFSTILWNLALGSGSLNPQSRAWFLHGECGMRAWGFSDKYRGSGRLLRCYPFCFSLLVKANLEVYLSAIFSLLKYSRIHLWSSSNNTSSEDLRCQNLLFVSPGPHHHMYLIRLTRPSAHKPAFSKFQFRDFI